jgi:hypothetical protein
MVTVRSISGAKTTVTARSASTVTGQVAWDGTQPVTPQSDR